MSSLGLIATFAIIEPNLFGRHPAGLQKKKI